MKQIIFEIAKMLTKDYTITMPGYAWIVMIPLTMLICMFVGTWQLGRSVDKAVGFRK